jgi:hypothetical protein
VAFTTVWTNNSAVIAKLRDTPGPGWMPGVR